MFRRLLAGLVALATIVGCGGSDDSASPSATVPAPESTSSTTTSSSVPQTPEEEVEAAYLKSWEIYTEAVRELDDSRLAEIYAGDALELRREEVADLRSANTPVRIEVEHNYSLQVVDGDRAVVLDTYRNHSVLLDPEAGQPTEDDPDEIVSRQYSLRKVRGTWKVVAVLAGPLP